MSFGGQLEIVLANYILANYILANYILAKNYELEY